MAVSTEDITPTHRVDALVDRGHSLRWMIPRGGELVAEADKISREDYAYIPLHFEQDTYAIKDTLNYTPRMSKYVLCMGSSLTNKS